MKENTKIIALAAGLLLAVFCPAVALSQTAPPRVPVYEPDDSVQEARMVEPVSRAEEAANTIVAAPDSVSRGERYRFTVATYNVDGLPPKISSVKVNMDGPQETGTAEIGRMLRLEGWDIVGLNEDFNYHQQLVDSLSELYNFGTWRGECSVAAFFRHGMRLPSDGLGLLYRKTIKMTDEEFVKWKAYFGYFNHGSDGLARKGFRHYTAEMPFGMMMDVFILHADAGEAPGDAWARKKQFLQLLHYITSADTRRPKIVMGDFNCFYDRDELKDYFIDSTNLAPHLTIRDICIEHLNQGIFPECTHTMGEDTLSAAEGEKLDHIVYINDDRADWQLQALFYQHIRSFCRPDGTPLSDHDPVVATLRATRRKQD